MGNCCGIQAMHEVQNETYLDMEKEEKNRQFFTPGEDIVLNRPNDVTFEEQKMNEQSRAIQQDEIASLQGNQQNVQNQQIKFQMQAVNDPSKSTPSQNNIQKNLRFDDNVNAKNNDQEIINVNKLSKEEKYIYERAKSQNLTPEEYKEQLLEDHEENEGIIVKIQALFRGFKERKDQKTHKGLSEKQKKNLPLEKFAIPAKEKDIISAIFKKHLQEYGQFNLRKPELQNNKRVRDLIQDKESVYLEPQQFIQHTGIYIGQWKKGSRHGFGRFIHDDYIYDGYWDDNQTTGFGRTIYLNGDMYEGEYFHDFAIGYGVYITKNKSKYEGQWSYNKPHGFGKETWNDGSKFVGTFSMGIKSGDGQFSFRDGSVYNGNFSQNKFNGQGKYIWPDQRQYVGNWSENQMHGQGKMTWSDGRSFTGKYCKGKRSGPGEFKWPNGEIYNGDWRNGFQHGFGYYTNQQNVKRYGEWKYAKFVQWIEKQ